MKKIGIIIFIIALFIGVIFANVFSFGQTSARFFNFNFSFKEVGSGNVIKQSREVSGFTQVDVSNSIQVEITAQKDFSVEVEADDNLLPLVLTEIRGGVLRIETDGRYKSKNPIIVRVSAPNIEDLDVSGASKVNLTNLNNESFQLHSSGASKIKVEGTTTNFEIKTSGASKIEAESLKAENVSVKSSGASRVSVAVTNDLKVKASGASNISYVGTPVNIERKTSGASNLNQK